MMTALFFGNHDCLAVLLSAGADVNATVDTVTLLKIRLAQYRMHKKIPVNKVEECVPAESVDIGEQFLLDLKKELEIRDAMKPITNEAEAGEALEADVVEIGDDDLLKMMKNRNIEEALQDMLFNNAWAHAMYCKKVPELIYDDLMRKNLRKESVRFAPMKKPPESVLELPFNLRLLFALGGMMHGGVNVLHVAAWHNSFLLKMIVTDGVNVKVNEPALRREKETALTFAAFFGHTESLTWLLLHGADYKCESLGTPLRIAVRGGHIECVSALLNAGAQITVTHSDFTALARDTFKCLEMVSCFCRDDAEFPTALLNTTVSAKKIEGFVSAGMNPNLRDSAGCSLLFQVCRDEDFSDEFSYSMVGKNALEHHITAYRPIDLELASLLFAAGEALDQDYVERLGCKVEVPELLRHWRDAIRAGVAVGEAHESLLGRDDIERAPSSLKSFLARLNFDQNPYVNPEDSPPPDKKEEQLKCVQLLLGAQADVNLANDKGVTPLMAAVNLKFPKVSSDYKYRMRYNYECVKLLLNMGADVDRVDNFGCSALFYAAGAGNLGAVLLLLRAHARVNVRCTGMPTP